MERGSPVTFRFSKWDGAEHWSYTGRWLGRDEHGDWVALPAGTRFVRPGRELRSPRDQVTLVPHPDAAERGWMAAFHAPGAGSSWVQLGGAEVQVYVDVTTAPLWVPDPDDPGRGAVVRAVDLDLDVVRGSDGTTLVDDEDEFAEHQRTLGYPDALVAAAQGSCDAVLEAVAGRVPPFDDTYRRWLAEVPSLGGPAT